jgi:exoribonuclease R
MAAARRIYQAFPNHALLRQHEPPNPKKLEQSVRNLEKEGYEIDHTRYPFPVP